MENITIIKVINEYGKKYLILMNIKRINDVSVRTNRTELKAKSGLQLL